MRIFQLAFITYPIAGERFICVIKIDFEARSKAIMSNADSCSTMKGKVKYRLPYRTRLSYAINTCKTDVIAYLHYVGRRVR